MAHRLYDHTSLEYPRPAYAGYAGSTGTRTPISPLSANGSVISLPRQGWAPSAPASAYGSAPPSPPRRYAQPYQVPQIPQQYRNQSTSTRRSQLSRHTNSTSSRASSTIPANSPPANRSTWGAVSQRDTWAADGQRDTWDSAVSRESSQSLSAEALRALQYVDETTPRSHGSPTEQAYDRLNGQAPRDRRDLYAIAEQKVLIRPQHKPTLSQSSVVPLLDIDAALPVEMPASTAPSTHRRSIPLMDAINPRISMLHGYGTYSSEDFHDFITAQELPGDGPSGPHELPTPQLTSAGASSQEPIFERRSTRNFSRSFAPVSVSSRRNESPEKGDWYLYQPRSRRRMRWIIIAIVVLIVLGAIIGGAVGGTIAKKKKS